MSNRPGTYNYEWLVAQSSNSTATSFASRVPTVTKPTVGTSVFGVGGYAAVELLPFGTDANNETGKYRILGWNQIAGGSAGPLWIPHIRCEFTVVLSSTAVGVADTSVNASQYFADTITIDNGIGVVSHSISDVPALITINCEGDEMLEIVYNRNSSAATLNALYRPVF